jgi:hypothetical protein
LNQISSCKKIFHEKILQRPSRGRAGQNSYCHIGHIEVTAAALLESIWVGINSKCSKISHCRIMRGKYTELKDVN